MSTGYGRGSKKLGFPTANLAQFDKEITAQKIERGVYFGWASVEGENCIYRCVSNVGISPTFVGQVREILNTQNDWEKFVLCVKCTQYGILHPIFLLYFL